MKIFTKNFYKVLIFLLFPNLLIAQELSPKQKQILERIEIKNRSETQQQDKIEKQLESSREKVTDKQKSKTEFYWEKGIGWTTRNIAQARNLKEYIWGGHIDCRDWAEKDDLSLSCDGNKNKLINFIWQNWFGKKRAYITTSGDSVDAGGTLHIFIEPDERGNFQIVRRVARWSAMSNPELQNLPKVFSVERVENSPKKGQWSLILKDKKGKLSGKLHSD